RRRDTRGSRRLRGALYRGLWREHRPRLSQASAAEAHPGGLQAVLRGGAPRAHGRRGGRKGSRLRLRSFVAGPDLADRFFAGAPLAVDRIVAAREVEPWVCTLESPPPRQVSLPAVFAGHGARRRRED